jgi:predicted O-methyltransferase YrrM
MSSAEVVVADTAAGRACLRSADMIARLTWTFGPPLAAARGLVGACKATALPLLAWRIGSVERHVACPHSIGELTTIARAILARRNLDGVVVELGCYQGGSTARLSLVCAEAGKRLVVFDSFEGLPEPEAWDADHRIRRPRVFRAGEYAAGLAEVRRNVARYGRENVCTFVPGWIADTVGGELGHRSVAVAFVDVDLVASTRDALEGVWPRLSPGGVAFVHDATDPKLAALLADDDWWRSFAEPPVALRLPDPDSDSTLAVLVKRGRIPAAPQRGESVG